MEQTFAVNHIGHFLLTMLLLDKIKASEAGRIVNVSSKGYLFAKPKGIINVDYDTKKYGSMDAYSQSKLANIYFTRYLDIIL